MSYSLKNDEIYKQTQDFIFSLDKNSNFLNLNMIQKLFKLFNQEIPKDMGAFINYYKSLSTTRDIMKNTDQSDKFDEQYIKDTISIYTGKNNELNIELLYTDISKINKDISKDILTQFINEYVFKGKENNIQLFLQYILELLK